MGLDLGHSKDGQWLVVAGVQPGSLCAVFSELKPGAKLIDVRVNGELYRTPTLQHAVSLIGETVGEIELVVMPLLDRYGFIISTQEFLAAPVTRDMIRHENSQLRKWQALRDATGLARLCESQAGQAASADSSGRARAVRGFVWKLMAAGHAHADFRHEGQYAALRPTRTGRTPSTTRRSTRMCLGR